MNKGGPSSLSFFYPFSLLSANEANEESAKEEFF
jgi:hypothetical protein